MATRKQMGGEGLTDQQQESLVHLGHLMGDPRDDFDREVEKHLADDYPHEAGHEKMKAAQTGGSLSLGPTKIEQQQAQQTQALQQRAAAAGQIQASQAQKQQMPVNAPPAPTGPVGTTTPYPAQKGPQGPPGGVATPEQEEEGT